MDSSPNQKLSDEDYALLPSYAKAYKCGCNERFENEWISLTPTYLRFPHDDPSQHLREITVWNKTPTYLEIIVQQPSSNVFQAVHQKTGIYGGTQTKISIRCNPHCRKMFFDCLRLRVNKDKREVAVISVPLELFPGMGWFVLPKLIVMPHVTIGNGAEVSVKLPRVNDRAEFFVVIRTPDMDSFTVIPCNGVLRPDEDGLSELTIRYTPKEYTTLVYIIEIHFPNVDKAPFEIIVFARSIPGFESEAIMRETANIARLKPTESTKKVQEPRMKLRPVTDAGGEESNQTEKEDLCTPAGVMHFLLRKGGQFHEHRKTVGALGLSQAQEQKVYKAIERDFHEKLNRAKIHQKNILIQNNKSFYGDEPLEARPDLVDKIIRERDLQLQQYEKALGLTENDAEDMTRTKLKVSNQRSLRRAGEDYGQEIPNFESSEKEIEKMTVESREIARQSALSRFIQMVYVVIIRNRCQKRLAKLKVLKMEIKSARKKAAKGDKRYKDHNWGNHDLYEGTLNSHLLRNLDFEEWKSEVFQGNGNKGDGE